MARPLDAAARSRALTTATENPRPSLQRQTLSAGCETPAHFALLAAVVFSAFALYLASALSLEERGGTIYFGADSWDYEGLAQGDFTNRTLRLHPVTVVLALGWMKLFSPLTLWLAPSVLLKAFFAFTGALGVWAAISAFSAFMSRTHALLWGLIYASSLTVWYFSSIEESKAVSTALVAIYLALYAHLRMNWTRRGALVLSAVLLAACLNEIVAAFLVAIPAVDIFIRHRRALRDGGWVVLHALAAPLALLILELGIPKRLDGTAQYQEGSNLFEMFVLYFSRNRYDLDAIFDFLQRWIFFNIAAPEPELNYAMEHLRYGGDFEPTLLHYLQSPLSAALLAAFVLIFVSACWFRGREESAKPIAGFMLALGAYALARMIFFFLFIPRECLLFSSGVTLAHLALLAIPFMASRLPYKGALLGATAVLLLAANAVFIFAARTVPLQSQ